MENLSDQQTSYKFGRFHLYPSEFSLLCDGGHVHLPPKIFEMLVVLVKNHGRLLDKETLMREIWPDTVVGEAALPQIITDLRKALAKALGQAPDDEYIETVPKRGYRFRKPVQEVPGEPSSSAVNPPTPVPPDPPSLDSPSIDSKIVIAVCLIGVSLVLLPYTYGSPINGSPTNWYESPINWAKIFASALQFIVILWAFISTQTGPQRLGLTTKEEEGKIRKDSGYDNEEDWAEAKDTAVAALKEYKKYWYGLLGSWYLLYFVLAFLWRYDPMDNHDILFPELTLRIVATLFNNCNSLMLALGYMILNKSTVIKEEDRTISDVPWIKGLILVAAVAVIQFVVVSLSLPGRSGSMNRANVQEAFDWVSGIAGAIALALYVGRLQSKFLGPPHKLLIALYSYTAIQPLYALLGRNKVAAVLIMYAALILKILLCFYIVRLFQEGRLLFYFVRVRRTYDKVNYEWQDFRNLIK